MSVPQNKHIQKALQWSSVSLGAISLAMIAFAFAVPAPGDSQLEGRLLPSHLRSGEHQWVTITAEDMARGRSIPAHANVIIQIPEAVNRITRRTLFGRRGERIRYWGYCFPADYDKAQQMRRRGFPGELFLSEKERQTREEFALKNRRRNFSVYQNLNDDDLNRSREVRGTIRHTKEIFYGGENCYVMTEEPLPTGLDNDRDGANIAVELDASSDPNNPDTDGDGIRDGLEIFRLNTLPTKRDTDGDGLIDGIEDFNRNGRVEKNETNPLEWDSDRDGLCDGLCLVNKGSELRGEDKNLNGIFEPEKGETDPRSKDTDRDGISDEQEYFNCLLARRSDC